jgi:methylamine dehydrogenase accessory protein MauD
MSAFVVSYVVLWVLVIALALVVLALARQIGVLHDRIAPAGALMVGKGLKVAEAAPVLSVNDLDGGAHAIGAPRADGKSTLLMFVSPTCPVCKTLLPVLKSSRRSEQSWLEILLASDGDPATHSAFRAANGLDAFAYVLSPTLGIAYQISRLPYAVLLDESGVVQARGLINSREHLESLFEAKRLGVASLQEYLDSRQGEKAA